MNDSQDELTLKPSQASYRLHDLNAHTDVGRDLWPDLLLVLQLVGQPIKALVKSVAAGRARGLDVPVALTQRMETELVGDLSRVHCVRQILRTTQDHVTLLHYMVPLTIQSSGSGHFQLQVRLCGTPYQLKHYRHCYYIKMHLFKLYFNSSGRFQFQIDWVGFNVQLNTL